MFFRNRSIGLVLMTGATLLPVSHVLGADLGNGWSPTPLEIAQTPAYCQKQFLSKHDGAVMAPLFKGCDRMNHLCPGLVLINRANNVAIPKQERKRILNQAKQEITYSLSKLTRTCIVYDDVKFAERRIMMTEVSLN